MSKKRTSRPRSGATDTTSTSSLRERARAMMTAQFGTTETLPAADDLARTLRELRVHQFELEIQNDELQRAQLELAQSRDRYVDLYEFAPAGFLTLDATGKVKEANLAAAAMLGCERQELPGKPLSHFVAAASQDAFFLHLQKVRTGAGRPPVEVEVNPPAHPPRFLELHSTARPSATPDETEVRTALVDVTARHEAARLLELNRNLEQRFARRTLEAHASAKHLAGILGSAMDAIISTDAEQRIVLFNRAAEQMFGWRADDIIGNSIDCLIPESLRDSHRRHFEEFSGKGATSRRMGNFGTISGRHADGSLFPVEASISQVEVEGQKVFTVIVRDITERVRTERQLRRNEQVLTDFFASAPLGLMWVGPDGRVLRANDVQLDLLERPPEEVVGQLVTELHADGSNAAAILEQLGQNKTVKNCHLSVRAKEGTIRHLLVDANGLWENGALVHSRWFVRDISHRLALECEILAVAERERARIGHDLHDDLCQQLVALEFSNEALVAQWGESAPAAAAKARDISARLREAIEYARELARGLTPNFQIENDGLTEALRELADRTQRIFGRRCSLECPVPVHLKDRDVALHLYRIAQEAVGNAIKHGKATEIVIRLAAQDDVLILGVEDNGIGLPVQVPKGKGAGLRIMQYRLGVIGGSLVVQRRANGGTAVVCTVKNAFEPGYPISSHEIQHQRSEPSRKETDPGGR